MRLVFAEQAWEDYLHWQATDPKLQALRDEEHTPAKP
jgi:Txe/YoeB family toxin of Txe-Axe toxin-antitoxin module